MKKPVLSALRCPASARRRGTRWICTPGRSRGGVIKVRFMKESQTLTFYLDGKIPAGN
ncbi:MAG: hypothetical protein J1E00_07465 [Oscillospiraceae bacterium]|nr:hypothetical protein [Oscillospiraceae bacterium]